MPQAEEELTVREYLALLTGNELFEASTETSAVYNGQIIKFALQIVMRRTHFSCRQLADRISLSRRALSLKLKGQPSSDRLVFNMLLRLLLVLEEDDRL